MTEELKIKVVADTSEFDGQMDKTGKKIDETSSKAEKSQSKWASFGQKMAALSPTFAKAQKGIGEQSSKMEGAFGKSIGAANLMKLGVIGAVAAIGVKVGQMAWKVASETARMFDPKGYSKAAGQMQKSIKKLKTTVGSFTAPLVNGIMTVVSKIADGLNWVLEKIRALRAFIWGVIKGMVQPVIDGIKQVISWIQQGINALANMLGFGDVFKKSSDSAAKTADSMGEVVEATSAGLASFDKLNTLDMSNAGDTEQAEKLSDSIKKAGELGEKIGKKLNIKGIVKELTKIDWKKVYDDFKATLGKIPRWFKTNVIDKITSIDWSGLWNGFCETMGGVGTWFSEKLGGILNFDWGGLWNGFCETLGGAGTWFKDNVLNPVLSFDWGGLWNGFTETMSNLKNWLLEKLSGVLPFDWTGLWTGLTDAFSGIHTWFKDKLDDVTKFDWKALWDGFVDTMKNIATFIKDKILEGINGAVGGVTSFAKDPVGGITSIPGKIADKIKSVLPHFADGGVAKPNNPFPVIVGDNLREPEVISPVSTIKTAVREAMQGMGGSAGSSGPIELTINLDSRKIARAVYDPLQTEARRRGSSF